MQSAIERILARLDERERKILVYRYGLGERDKPQTLEQVGSALGVTKERIRQIEARAISKLRRFAKRGKARLKRAGLTQLVAKLSLKSLSPVATGRRPFAQVDAKGRGGKIGTPQSRPGLDPRVDIELDPQVVAS